VYQGRELIQPCRPSVADVSPYRTFSHESPGINLWLTVRAVILSQHNEFIADEDLALALVSQTANVQEYGR
jgi:hypothetical protein